MKWLSLLAVPFALWAKVPQLAVLPLSPHGIDSSDAAILTDALSDAFLRTGTVRILERQQMNEILKEQGFEQSGACDGSECAVKAGQLLGIDQIVVGSIGKLGSSYVLSLRRVDVGTGEILASSSRDQSGAINELLHGIVPDAVSDLSGVRPKSPVPFASSAKPSHAGTTPALSAGTATVVDVGFHSVSLKLGRDSRSRDGDRFTWVDSEGNEAGWVRLTERAADPQSGGTGRATIISGNPKEGEDLKKVSQLPFAFEAHVGKEVGGYNHIDYISTIENPVDSSTSRSSFADFSAIAWYRPGLFSNLWFGIGILVDAYNLEKTPTGWYTNTPPQTNTSRRYAVGPQIDLRKGYTIYKRLGWFFQLGETVIPTTDWARWQTTAKTGLSLDLTPGLSVQGDLGGEWWITKSSHEDNSGPRGSYGLSLVWIP